MGFGFEASQAYNLKRALISGGMTKEDISKFFLVRAKDHDDLTGMRGVYTDLADLVLKDETPVHPVLLHHYLDSLRLFFRHSDKFYAAINRDALLVDED
jgi:hypothetical protein